MAKAMLIQMVPEAFAFSVGRVVTEWAWVEAVLDQCIWRMLGVRPKRGRIITSNLTARIKIEALASLLRKSRLNETFVKEVEGEGKALAELRNLVAHGYISVRPGSNTGIIVSFLAKGEIKERSRQITPPLLDKLSERITLYLQYLVENSTRLPKQRGQQKPPSAADPKRRPLRIGTIVRRLPPPLEVERPKDQTHEEQQAAREAKRLLKAEHRRKSNDGRKKDDS
jgi:hypothetical protein